MPVIPPSVVVAAAHDNPALVKLDPDDFGTTPRNTETTGARKTHIEVCVRLRPLVIGKESSNSFWEQNANSSSSSSSQPPSPSRQHPPGNHRSAPRFIRKPQIPRATTTANNNRSRLSPTRETSSHEPSIAVAQQQQPPEDSAEATAATNGFYAWEALSSNTMRQSARTDIVPGRTHTYTLDRVYGPESTTQQLYETSVKHLVHGAMDGYHTAVLAYGQTSTGKTHSMTGTLAEPGLIPLCIQECFQYLQTARSNEEDSREYLLRVSYLEIYKEQIRDLLNSSKTAAPIRLFDSADGLIIKGLTEHVVTCPNQVFKYLAQGEARRQIGCTHMNQHSSRSHVIVRLWMESKPITYSQSAATPHQSIQQAPLSPTSSISSETYSIRGGYTGNGVRVSSLSLVDLAGSESVKLSGSNERRQEGHYINKSLMTLGQVVYALSEAGGSNNANGISGNITKNKHVPYRDSKLTRLLQPSLSGNAQVVLICCISPLVNHIEESHNTFKFAIRAKKIPQCATITEAGRDEKTLLQTYRDEIEELKQQLREARAQHEAFSQRQASNSGGASGSSQLSVVSELVDDDDDIAQLVQSIQTMERLILKSKPTENAIVTASSRISGIAPEDLLDDTLLSIDADDELDSDEENLLALTDSVSLQQAASFSTPPRLVHTSTTTSSSFTAVTETDRDLHAELRRVQGLLGSVLQKKRSSAAASVNTVNTFEVRQLRAQLEEQEVASSFRKADSFFLQKQLEEKDKLLAEVAKILEAMEEQQLRLEEENARLRRQLNAKNDIPLSVE